MTGNSTDCDSNRKKTLKNVNSVRKVKKDNFYHTIKMLFVDHEI